MCIAWVYAKSMVVAGQGCMKARLRAKIYHSICKAARPQPVTFISASFWLLLLSVEYQYLRSKRCIR